jgi:hypothetical protein
VYSVFLAAALMVILRSLAAIIRPPAQSDSSDPA